MQDWFLITGQIKLGMHDIIRMLSADKGFEKKPICLAHKTDSSHVLGCDSDKITSAVWLRLEAWIMIIIHYINLRMHVQNDARESTVPSVLFTEGALLAYL